MRQNEVNVDAELSFILTEYEKACGENGSVGVLNACQSISAEITRLHAEKDAEIAQIVAMLRSEAADYHSIREPNEEQRMYRLGQHDALLLASDAIERGDYRALTKGQSDGT